MKKLILSFFTILGFSLTYGQNASRPDFQLPEATNLSVNSYAGNLIYERQDLFIPGRGLDIDIHFFYNSAIKRDWGYGYGWSNDYNISLEFNADGEYLITWGNNAKDIFIKNGSDFTPPVGVYHKLEEYESDKYRLTTKFGIKYYFDQLFKRISRIEDRNGNTLSFTYNRYGITSITDPSNRVIQFIWINGKMVEIIR